MNKLFKPYFFCLVLLIAGSVSAQHNVVNISGIQDMGIYANDTISKIRINNIEIKGNKKTKQYIIYREVHFKTGDSLLISKLNFELERARQQIYNTTLFVFVNITAVQSDAGLNLEIEVRERWYVYPSPQFQVNSRNLSEWLNKYHADLSRAVYGVKFDHNNLTGRRDQLSLYFLTGFSRNILFSYNLPYINKALTKGFSISGGFSQTKEVICKTIKNDRLLAFNSPDFAYTNYYLRVGYSIRKAIRTRHNFNIQYSVIEVNDSVIHPKYNPNYFGVNSSRVGFFDISYSLSYNDVDNNAYPLSGINGYVSVSKRGLDLTGGLNNFSIETSINKFFKLKHHWYPSVHFIGKIKLPFDLAYINQRGLGYGDAYLRGLENYVVDGSAYTVVKTNLRKKILDFTVNLPFNIHIKQIPFIPFTFYAKTFADAGYCYSIDEYKTHLNNQLLYTGGFGIDLLSIYDSTIKLEYSFNQLGKKGLFLRAQMGF